MFQFFQIAQNFCDYMKQLGGDQQSQLFTPRAIKELFQVILAQFYHKHFHFICRFVIKVLICYYNLKQKYFNRLNLTPMWLAVSKLCRKSYPQLRNVLQMLLKIQRFAFIYLFSSNSLLHYTKRLIVF